MLHNLVKCLLALSVLIAVMLFQPSANADVFRTKFNTDSAYLAVEILDDDLAHFEVSALGQGLQNTESIYTSPMLLKKDYSGPSELIQKDNIIETKDLILNINKSNLCIEVTDKTKQNAKLTTICPTNLGQALKGLDINPGKMQNVYGLGQEFKTLGSADGDLISKGIRQGLNGLGNGFQGFQNAAVGNVQIPVYYAVGDNLNYALFMDNVYWQKWDFTKPTWEARMYGDQLRFYVMTGADLPDLRADFMELTGTPPVPSLKSFGLWVSEFGYDNWNQIDTLAQGLRKDNFPLDGFVLDLNWFGGIRPLEKTNMGRLDWDENQEDFLKSNLYAFAKPDEKIKEYAQDGISLAAIEESYLAQTNPPLPTFKEMPANLMAYQQTNGKCDANNQKPIVINANDFWGTGNMFDWSDTQTGKWIHDNRRFPNLVKKGINTHWTDLGEPERFDGSACYEGVETNTLGKKNKHGDIHNIYNLLWNKSIWQGYVDKQGETDQLGVTNPRPLILTRSGAAGIQRYGAAMWSGDIASNLESLATHANAQMEMSFSGIDYYGSDIGGFRREVMPGNDKSGSNTSYQEELYTQWFANGSWFDIPVRPHTDDEFNSNDQNPSCQSNFGNRQAPCYETAPDLLGKTNSNLANIRQRYELLPYYYSLGYRAFLKGEPVIPPPVFYYQNDPNLRQIGNEKMIGKDILVGMVANHGEYQRDMYLPAGKWVNYHSNEWFNSSGKTLKNVPVYRNGILRLPTFVRSGAIIPQMFVDENTKDAFGNRKKGATPHDELIAKVYADEKPSNFTLYEDDGLTLNYDDNGRPVYYYRTTTFTQQQTGNTVNVTIDAAVNKKGTEEVTESFTDAINNRSNVVKLIVNNAIATAVNLNDSALTKYDTKQAFEQAVSGWYNAGNNVILAKSDKMDVFIAKNFTFELESIAPTTSVNLVCDAGFTTPGKSIYAVGNINALGNWNPANAVKLEPNIYYSYISRSNTSLPGPTKPVWTGIIDKLNVNTTFEWKCIKRQENNPSQVEWQPGNNNIKQTNVGGYAGNSYGTF